MNTTTMTSEETPWAELVPYGDWPHSKGLQRITKENAQVLVRDFHSLKERLRRRFGGIPIFIGHPDDPDFSGKTGHEDTRAYGWIADMEARDEGLYILPKWSEQGKALLENAFYKHFSPRWSMKASGQGNVVYTPIRLISVGLTNHPNIQGQTIANEDPELPAETKLSDSDFAVAVATLLGLEPDCDRAWLLDSVSELSEESERFYRLASEAHDTCAKLKADLAQALEDYASEHASHVETLLKQALQSARIDASETQLWREKLHDNFDQAKTELFANQSSLPTQSRVDPRSAHKPSAAFLSLVHEHMHKGLDYASAWTSARKQHPEAYERLS